MEKGYYRPGDSNLPAADLNVFAETARRVDDARSGGKGAGIKRKKKVGTDFVFNTGTGDIGRYEMAEITDPEEGTGLVGVAAYSEEPADGKGVYVITLEPIAAGQTGRAAFSGGPWKLDVSGTDWESAEVGDVIGPGGIFVMSKAPDGGICEVVFAAGSGEPVYYAQAGEDMTADYDDTDETTIANTTYTVILLDADGTYETDGLGDPVNTIEAARQAGVDIDEGDKGFIIQSYDGIDLFIPIYRPLRAVANEKMTADDTLYDVRLLGKDGTLGGVLSTYCYRDPDVEIKTNQRGIITFDKDGNRLFTLAGTVEERDSDPASGNQWPGRMWAVDIT